MDYFTSPFALTILGSFNGAAASLAGLCLAGVLGGTRIRGIALSVIFAVGLFTWAFIGLSLLLTATFFPTCEYDANSFKTIAGGALAGGLAIGFPLAFVMRHHATSAVLSRIRDATPPEADVLDTFRALAEKMKVKDTELLHTRLDSPTSLIVSRKKNIIVISDSLQRLLNEEELSTVLAHELAHVKNADLTFKTLFAVYRFVVPFDPLIRLAEAAAHRQRELLADEVSARVTGKPIALASALIKMHEALMEAGIFRPTLNSLSFYSFHRTRRLFSRQPSLSERVNQLLKIANTLDPKST